MTRAERVAGALAAMLALVAACGDRRKPEAAEVGPAAPLQPSPLVSAAPPVDLSASGAPERALAGAYGTFGPSSPVDARIDQPLPADTLTARDASGVAFAGEWRWADVPGPPKGPEVSADGIAAARRLTSMRWAVSLTEAGRLRVVFDARSLPLPLGTELRARSDFYGHALVFPSGGEYRVVPPGALRALFGDRRLDVVPLVPGEIRTRGPAPPRRGQPVRRVEIASRVGVLQLDTIRVPEAGVGAALFCRLFVELVAVDPASAACARDELPVHAQLSWPSGGSVVFDMSEPLKRQELPTSEVLCPPPQAAFAPGAMPRQVSNVFLTREEASAFRLRAIDLPPPAPGAPAEGVLARNGADGLRYIVLDGVPLAWVPAGAEQVIVGPPRGRYVTQWRSFLGDSVSPARTIEVPARIALGEGPEVQSPTSTKTK